MAVRIGSARIDEYGRINSGKAGDQTGGEVATQDWYLHKKGWVVLRAKDDAVAEKIAQCMEQACANNNIGYDQYQRNTLYNAVKNKGFKCDKNSLKTKVETDCSALVRVCMAYAGVKVGDFNTSSQRSTILGSGKFRELSCGNSSLYLKRGDILVTKTKGHTVVVLSNGSKIKATATQTTTAPAPSAGGVYMFSVDTVKKGSKGKSVLLMQTILRGKGYKGKDGKELSLDGDCGTNSVYAINSYQSARRKAGVELGANGKNDGVCGATMWKDLLQL